jgi:4-hydroxybenzoate polyprenyltransferase
MRTSAAIIAKCAGSGKNARLAADPTGPAISLDTETAPGAGVDANKVAFEDLDKGFCHPCRQTFQQSEFFLAASFLQEQDVLISGKCLLNQDCGRLMIHRDSLTSSISDSDCDESSVNRAALRGKASFPTGLFDNASFYAVVAVIRPRHWIKNFLLFVPIVLTGHFGEYEKTKQVVIAFVLYCALASCVYVINDIFDLPHDRAHARKRSRPFASGALSPSVGMPIGIAGTLLVLLLGFACVPALFFGLLIYSVASLLYSLKLKRFPIIDTLLLAAFYVWRLYVGATAADLPLSGWLTLFSMLFFFSVSLAKRFSELSVPSQQENEIVPGRGYRPNHKKSILVLGILTGVSSVLVFAEYLRQGAFSAADLSSPGFLWVCLATLALWLLRLWTLCIRGELQDDPVEFVLNDRASRVLVTASGIATLLALVI